MPFCSCTPRRSEVAGELASGPRQERHLHLAAGRAAASGYVGHGRWRLPTPGEFSPIATSLPATRACELMFSCRGSSSTATIRGVNHHIPDHNPGSMFMLGSGNPPNPTIFHPTWSAVVKKESDENPAPGLAMATCRSMKALAPAFSARPINRSRPRPTPMIAISAFAPWPCRATST